MEQTKGAGGPLLLDTIDWHCAEERKPDITWFEIVNQTIFQKANRVFFTVYTCVEKVATKQMITKI